MQATGNLHQEVRNTIFRQPQDIFDNATPLDACKRMLDDHAYAGNEAIEELVCDAEVFPWRFFLAGWSVHPLVHTLESQCLCRAWR